MKSYPISPSSHQDEKDAKKGNALPYQKAEPIDCGEKSAPPQRIFRDGGREGNRRDLKI